MSCWTDPQGVQHCPTNNGNITNTCAPLASDPHCAFIESQCIEGASDVTGHCYAYTVRYDCGEDVVIPTMNVESTYTLSGRHPLHGQRLRDHHSGVKPQLCHAVAALQAADYMALDMSCPVNAQNNIDPNTCKVFTGEASECKTAVGGYVDCCKKPASGVSLAQYIVLMEKTCKAASVALGEGGVLHGAWTKLTEPVSNVWNSVTSYFATSADTNAAATASRTIGWEALKQSAMKNAAQFLVDTFGTETASAFFTNGTSTLATNGL